MSEEAATENKTYSEKVTQIVDLFLGLSVMELLELQEALEEKGIKPAAAAVAVGGGGGGGGGGEAAAEKTSFDVIPEEWWRQEDPGHQGSPRHHEPRLEGGQGTRRRSPEASQGRHSEGRSREDQSAARRSWRRGRVGVSPVREGAPAPSVRRFAPLLPAVEVAERERRDGCSFRGVRFIL